MTIRFSVPGAKDPSLLAAPAATEPFEDEEFAVKVTDGARVFETRAGSLAEIEAAEDDVVELTFEDGVVFCVPASVLRDDIAPAANRGDTDTGAQIVRLPPRFAFGAQSRGIRDWVLRAVRVFGVKAAADVTAAKLIDHVEGKLNKVGPGPGLYYCQAPNLLGPKVQGDLPGEGPVLVLIHGTASHTNGSFGALVEEGNAPTWAEIRALYRDRVFALEHRTLSQSPIENALELARHLPQDARLHLITHSRGGLVGELLCRSGFDETDLRQFEGAAWQQERDRLTELGELLAGRRVRVDRFVRVACPARGTTLASRRLDRYLSLILNCIGLIPALAGSPLYGWVKSLLIAVAKKRADPEDLPGLEAQMPESRLVKILNRQGHGFEVDADLTVIAGDIQGAGVWQRLGVLATDLFYREDHDLVVNTWAMTGGGRRTSERALYAFDTGGEVSHFNYFRNPHTVGKLVSALRSEEERRREFLPLPKEPQPLVKRGPATAGAAKPYLFLLPGIMGSCLSAGGDRIWLDLDDIAEGKIGRLEIGGPGSVRVDGLMPEYSAISYYLSASHEVVPFDFDWRLSLFDEAKRLAKAVEQRLEAGNQTIRFLAHSMGGLVVRALIAAHPDLWAKVAARPKFRFVMLGTPNLGSYVIPHILLGRERIFRHLALLDLTRNRSDLARLVGRFPGLLDMLPVDPQADTFAAGWWGPLAAAVDQGWPEPDPELLATARANRQRLDRDGQPEPRYTVYVAGVAPQTPWGISVTNAGGRPRLDLRGTARGDGRVTWASGIPRDVPTWYMDAVHGRLACHPPAFLALQELLETGTSDRLSRQPPMLRAIESDFPFADRGVDLFPDNRELTAAALGYEPERGVTQEEELQLKVSITLGNLAHARFPVLVGHYQNDGLYSAEAVLDDRLGGRLSRRYSLGAYAGEPGTSVVVLDPSCRPPGACVAGLGEVGSLSPGGLSQIIAKAAVRYAAEVTDRESWPPPMGLSTVLIGSGEAGVTLQDSIAAILKGVAAANRRLAERSDLRSAVIREVELVELVEDVAICAARVLRDFEKHQTIPGFKVVAARDVRRVPGARRRIPCGADDSWWRRLRIDEQKDGTLTFTSLTERARVEEMPQPTQSTIAQRLIDRAMSSTVWDPRGAHTLYSLLVPNAIKSYAPDERKVVLLLDEKTARFPWELLADEAATEREPFSVRAGVVRQLRSTRFRPRPLAASGRAALVIGDPPTKYLARLEAAQAEAAEVALLLRGGFQPTHLDRPTPEAVLDALFTEPYRILHFAGHGELRMGGASDERPVAGMVLDDGLLLTAREIRNLTTLPDLAVINCCHVGAMGTDAALRSLQPPLFASSLATELIEMGVRAVVAAGWAVDDGAARTFALELYSRLLRGQTFGEAVQEARIATYRAHPASNTWGAYQCYGDPGFRLRLAEDIAPTTTSKYVDPCEPLVEIENLLSGEDGVAVATVNQLLNGLQSEWPEWLKRADLAAAVAKALFAAGEAQESAKYCLEALRAKGGDLPFDILETLSAAVAAGASVEVPNFSELLEWLERWAPAPSRLVQIATYRAALARSLNGEALDKELGRIEELLKPFEKEGPDTDIDGLLALAEIRTLIREQKPQRGAAAPIRLLLERLHKSFAALEATEPARARPLAVRLSVLDLLLKGEAIQIGEALLTSCATIPVGPGLTSALALARYVLAPDQGTGGLSEKRIRQREAWLRDLAVLETRLLRR